MVSLPSACFACCRNAGRPLVKTTCLPFSEVDRHCSLRDAYFLANIQVSLSVISVANVFALWYDKSHKSGLSEMRVSQNNRKGKNAEQMLHDANDLKSYQMIWLGQRIFVMTTASFAHLKSFLHCDEICQG